MLKYLHTFIIAVILSLSFQASANNEENPYKLIERVADKTFKRIANEQQVIKNQPEHLKKVVTEELLPYVDYRYAAYKVLGKNFRKFTAEQREDFVHAFRDYLVSTYAGVLTLYKNQAVIFEPEQSVDGKKIVMITTKVIDEGKPDIKINFKVRRTKTQGWLAYDMVAEGISLLDSKRAELGGLIMQQGLDSVTSLLKEKAKRPIEIKEKDAK
ncbi:MlaC/ttg2D family ABC transporter substrate-binding protein [Flocculibacter collagenilyticus]|uniref:MlaC/ttg2D family ABC transporter substrate-binding protein n=1 Tax=Flocculibacter collagenilyticus TaxID=2744479 RepID=UPI0018F7CACD|nr:ABC transporter substrate-binding protein [Flocculibacter collagenilyticus]